MVVFIFGLHGLGFAGVISEIGLSQTHFLTSLISFNIGVELRSYCHCGLLFWFFILDKRKALV